MVHIYCAGKNDWNKQSVLFMCLQSIQTGHVVYSSTIYYNFGHLKSGTTFLDYNFQFGLSAFIKGDFFCSFKIFFRHSYSAQIVAVVVYQLALIPTQKSQTMHMFILHIYFSTKKNAHRENGAVLFSFNGPFLICQMQKLLGPILHCRVHYFLSFVIDVQFAFDVLFFHSPTRLKTLSTVQFKIKKMVLFVYVRFATNGSIMLVLLYKKKTKQ